MVAQSQSQVIGKPLQGNDAEESWQSDAWFLDEHDSTFGKFGEFITKGFVFDVRNYDCFQFNQFCQLLNMLDHLIFFFLVVQKDEYWYRLWVLFEKAIKVVPNLTELEVLAVQVGQFLHFESCFSGDPVGDSDAAEEDMFGILNLQGNLLGFLIDIVKSILNIGW